MCLLKLTKFFNTIGKKLLIIAIYNSKFAIGMALMLMCYPRRPRFVHGSNFSTHALMRCGQAIAVWSYYILFIFHVIRDTRYDTPSQEA